MAIINILNEELAEKIKKQSAFQRCAKELLVVDLSKIKEDLCGEIINPDGDLIVFGRVGNGTLSAKGNVYVFGDVRDSNIKAGKHAYVEGNVFETVLQAGQNLVVTGKRLGVEVANANLRSGRNIIVNGSFLGKHAYARGSITIGSGVTCFTCVVAGEHILIGGNASQNSSVHAGENVFVRGSIDDMAHVKAGGEVSFGESGERCEILCHSDFIRENVKTIVNKYCPVP